MFKISPGEPVVVIPKYFENICTSSPLQGTEIKARVPHTRAQQCFTHTHAHTHTHTHYSPSTGLSQYVQQNCATAEASFVSRVQEGARLV